LVELKLAEVDQLVAQQKEIEKRMLAIYKVWPEAQRVDEVRGIGMVTAVSVLAHVGPIGRFATAEDLISYAGLAPGVHRSDQTCHHGRLGGGGTDGHLRYLVIEASIWLRGIPRYRATYERVVAKRGKKIGRIVVARLFLRSLHKMLKDQLRFNPAAVRTKTTTATATATAGLQG
jgi:transposase